MPSIVKMYRHELIRPFDIVNIKEQLLWQISLISYRTRPYYMSVVIINKNSHVFPKCYKNKC